MAICDLYARVRRQGSGDAAIHDAAANDIATGWQAQDPYSGLLNGRRTREWKRSFSDLPLEPVQRPSTSPRQVHWNIPASQRAAIAEWREALLACGVVPD